MWVLYTVEWGIIYGRMAVRKRVIVLNDPDGLSKAMNKLYFQTFPKNIRPATLITRDKEKIFDFFKKYKRIVIKPAVGSQGRNVFLVSLFMLNGDILEYDGVYAAFKRVPKEGTIRTNIHAGGKFERAKIDDKIIEIAKEVSPKLKQDGIFFAGLDIVGNRLLEVNVFSPGGIDKVKILEGVDFAPLIVQAIERKVFYKELYEGNFSNIELNIL